MRFQTLLSVLPYYLFLQALGSPVTSSSPATTNAQNSTNFPSILDDETEKFVNKVLSDWKSPGGIAIAFVRKDENGNWVNVESKGYGRANYKGDKVTEQTNFNVGSNSKLFTAVATGLLVNNASLTPRLTWESKIKDFVPELNVTDTIFNREANLLDLGSHRTGYPRHEFSYLYSDSSLDLIKKMALQRQSTEFRSNWQYDNNMYTVLSYLPEKILGEKFARYVKRTIFEPLNMTSSTYSYDIADKTGFRAEGMAREYINYYNGDTFSGNPRNVTYWASNTVTEDGNLLSGSGGVITNAIDVAKWLQALLLNGRAPHNNQTVIPPNVLPKLYSANAIQSNTPAFPEESSIVYGFAQVQITYRGHLIVEHPGFIRGFNTQISRLPNDNFGVAVLTNDHDYGRSTSQIVKYYIMDRALGYDPIDWNTRLLAQQSVPPTAATPRPVNASLPDAPFPAFTGNYTSSRVGLGGYGDFELCLVQPPNPNQSATCKKLADSIPTVLPGAVRPNIPTYFGAFNSPWFTHMRMEHFNGNIFNISLLISTPTGDAKQPFWTFNDRRESDNLQTAETVHANGTYGIGMAGLWSGVWVNTPTPVTPKPVGNTPYERAEFFWDKVRN